MTLEYVGELTAVVKELIGCFFMLESGKCSTTEYLMNTKHRVEKARELVYPKAEETTKVPYTYQVLRYVHDPAIGEAINVGVIIYARKESKFWIEFRCIGNRPLAVMFKDFDPATSNMLMENIQRGLKLLKDEIKTGAFKVANVSTISQRLIPDNGLSYQFGDVLGGIEEPDEEHGLTPLAQRLYERFVLSSRPGYLLRTLEDPTEEGDDEYYEDDDEDD